MSEIRTVSSEETSRSAPPESPSHIPISRREFMGGAVAGVSVGTYAMSARAFGTPAEPGAAEAETPHKAGVHSPMNAESRLPDEIRKEKIRRALLSGPDCVTREATVAEMDAYGNLTVLRQGTNKWVCIPGNQNIIGAADMCADPMGMQWMMDCHARKPKPTNSAPGLIYMLNGATQHSYTDPFDRTSPAIPIGPHWMILWPFDATAAGLPAVMRDGGTLVMFAGTPYAHLHICGSPWDGNEYHPGNKGVWTMTYARP
jgi:hypothetical protein